MKNNTSILSLTTTARTNKACAFSRAENLTCLGAVGSVIELCVGPSLKTLEQAYQSVGLSCVGNDIDRQWQNYYHNGSWVMGDCFKVPWYDNVVFAPPLSEGCTGKREDSLSPNKVRPSYYQFINEVVHRNFNGWVTMVLPGRCWRNDRGELHDILNAVWAVGHDVHVVPLYDARKRVVKYVDIYWRKR